MSALARGGGRHFPPRDGLVGRTEAARILQCDRQKVRRLERKGLLIPALVDADGVTWFDQRTVRALAAHLKNERASAKILVASRGASLRSSEATAADAYYPELGGRRVSVAAMSKRPTRAPGIAKESLRAGRKSATSQRGLGPQTPSRDEWWNEVLPVEEPAESKDLEEVNPAWFDDDFKPED